MRVVCFKVDESLHRIIQNEAKARGMSVSQLIRGAIWTYLTNNPRKSGSSPRIEVVRFDVK